MHTLSLHGTVYGNNKNGRALYQGHLMYYFILSYLHFAFRYFDFIHISNIFFTSKSSSDSD